MSQLHTNYVTRTNLLEESVSLSIKWDLKYLKNSFKFLNSIFSKLMLGNQSCKSGQLQSNHLSKWLQILFKDKVHRPNCLCSSKLTFTTPLFQGVRYFSVAWQIESKLFGLATFVFFWANLKMLQNYPPGPGQLPHHLRLITVLSLWSFIPLMPFICLQFLVCYTWPNWFLFTLHCAVQAPSGCLLPRPHGVLQFLLLLWASRIKNGILGW